MTRLADLIQSLPADPQDRIHESPRIPGIHKLHSWTTREERIGYGSSASYCASRVGNTDTFKITRMAQGKVEQYDLLLCKGRPHTERMLDFLVHHDRIMHDLLLGYEVEGYNDPLDLWLEGWLATKIQS